jgi:hypothetical protein
MTNNKQQTAVEWLFNELLNAEPNVLEWNKLLEQAKGMDKEQTMDFALKFMMQGRPVVSYYEEIYGGNK